MLLKGNIQANGAGEEEEKTNKTKEIPEIQVRNVETCVWMTGIESAPSKFNSHGLPGGKKQQEDKNLWDTVIREVREETGFEINGLDFEFLVFFRTFDRKGWFTEKECLRVNTL